MSKTFHPITKGNPEAKILIIGECLGSDEVSLGKPFVGDSGRELDNMLFEAGIIPTDCFFTNILHDIPPFDAEGPSMEMCFTEEKEARGKGMQLFRGRYPSQGILDGVRYAEELIKDLEPNLIVAMGNTALWALTGEEGIAKWRGSIMSVLGGRKLIPTFNPAAVTRFWPRRWIVVQDLRRVKKESEYPEIRTPEYKFHIRPSFDDVMNFLNKHEGKVVAEDIETWSGKIDCIGIGVSKTEAMCIPITCFDKKEGYWSRQEEIEITIRLRKFMENSLGVFANGIFDIQHIARQWGFLPKIHGDTQVQQHVCFPGISDDTKLRGKSLAFVASFYCDQYCFWKDESKIEIRDEDNENLQWGYNCKDCCYTFEGHEELLDIISQMGLTEQYQLLIDLHGPLLEMMLRGMRVNEKMINLLDKDLMDSLSSRSEWFEKVLGHPLNPRSNPQMTQLFYDDFEMKRIRRAGRKGPTCDDEALKTFKYRQPLLIPLCDAIIESRSIGVFRSNFVHAKRDPDNRMRSSLNPANVETFRLGSSKTVFKTGCNMQTIPSGHELEDQ